MTTTAPAYITDDVLALRRAVYDAAAEISDVTVDPADVARLASERIGYPVDVDEVDALLADPGRFSPYVDDVAVERALSGEHPAPALSDYEQQIVGIRIVHEALLASGDNAL